MSRNLFNHPYRQPSTLHVLSSIVTNPKTPCSYVWNGTASPNRDTSSPNSLTNPFCGICVRLRMIGQTFAPIPLLLGDAGPESRISLPGGISSAPSLIGTSLVRRSGDGVTEHELELQPDLPLTLLESSINQQPAFDLS